MGKVIINADDFGYSRGINYAIVDCHTQGILTSTTIMANMPGFDHAVSLAKENPELGIGVHLTLSCGKPLLNTHKTLVNEDGSFKKADYFAYSEDYDEEEIKREWTAQIEKVIASGIKPTHLDSHQHVHTFRNNSHIIVALARKYKLAVRNNVQLPDDIRKVNRFETEFDRCDVRIERPLRSYLENLQQDIITYGSVEIMCHPGYLDAGVLHGSSLLNQRVDVAGFLMHSEFAKTLRNHPEIRLVSYRDI